MKIVIQKINSCELSVDEKPVSKTNHGLLVFVGVSDDDTIEKVEYLARKIAKMRLFRDDQGKTNLSLLDVGGDIMLVSNFTLLAQISTGSRPSFSRAGDPEKANELYLKLADEFRKNGVKHVATGMFGNHMHLKTDLDGPFTIIMEKWFFKFLTTIIFFLI